MVTATDIERAVAFLREDYLVAFPTETVYGLGANAASPDAMQWLYAVKRRPVDHPVIVHLAADADLHEYITNVGPIAELLAQTFWPGPLTLLLERRVDRVADEVCGALPTVGIRVPQNDVAQQLLRAFGGGLAAPSANRYGQVSPTTAKHVHEDLGPDVAMVLDGGTCTIGLESTIVDCSGKAPLLVREGAITREKLEEVIGSNIRAAGVGEVRAPGTHVSHYAPRTHVELCAAGALLADIERHQSEGKTVGVLAMQDVMQNIAKNIDPKVVQLPFPDTPDDYARTLYNSFREADARGVQMLLAVPPEHIGIGAAVCDRLHRAAAPRPDQ